MEKKWNWGEVGVRKMDREGVLPPKASVWFQYEMLSHQQTAECVIVSAPRFINEKKFFELKKKKKTLKISFLLLFFFFCCYGQHLLTPISWHFSHQQSNALPMHKEVTTSGLENWIENWTTYDFSFLFPFFFAINSSKSRNRQWQSEIWTRC